MLPAILRWPLAHAIVATVFVAGTASGWVAWRRFQPVARQVERALNRHNATLALQEGFLEAQDLARGYVVAGDTMAGSQFLELDHRLPALIGTAIRAGQQEPDRGRRLVTASLRGLAWYRTTVRPAVEDAASGRRAEAARSLAAGRRTADSVTATLAELAEEQAGEAREAWRDAVLVGRTSTPVLVAAVLVALMMVLAAVTALGRITERAIRGRTELALVVEAVPYGFLELDADLNIRRISRRAAQILGLERRGLPATALTSLLAEASREAVRLHLLRVQGAAGVPVDSSDSLPAPGGQEEIEAGLPGADGATRTLVILAAALDDVGGRLAVVIRDVTRERAAREQLRQSERLATIGGLASGVAHELNNPLSAIATFAQTIDTAGLSAGDADALRAIGDEALRAGGIVRNLLGFARRRRPERKPVAVGPIIERTLVLRRYELRKDGADVSLDCPSDLPLVEGDDQQLQQVILNLVVNAHHAMLERPRDERRLAIRVRGNLACGVTIAVEDTGPGIPPEALPRLFEPFFTTKPEGVGTGLGLSLSQGIIAEHDGRIWAENRQEGGARFVVELPHVVATGHVPAAAPVSRLVDIGSRSILVADDDEGGRRALQRLLTKLGHRVETASDGRSALARLRAESFDVIISDLHMPEVSGEELFRIISRERPELARRFLFISGDTVSQDARAFLEAAGQPALRKPYEIRDLQHILARLVTGDVRARASGMHWSLDT